VRADPALMTGAVEECLRHVGPVGFSAMRFSTADIVLGDVTIPAGHVVALGLWAADHDRAQFPAPYTFDIIRQSNPHVAFGRGTHFCVGANLARMEAQVALTVLLGHFDELALAVPDEQLQWRPANTRGPISLPLKLVPARCS
jgi:cytochrome P450